MILYEVWVTYMACRERNAQKQVCISKIKSAYKSLSPLVPPQAWISHEHSQNIHTRKCKILCLVKVLHVDLSERWFFSSQRC